MDSRVPEASMKRYLITLTARQDILIGQQQGIGNYQTGSWVIPGRAWRGAYANSLMRTAQDTFEELFVRREPSAQIRFGPLFPSGFDQATQPLPPTARSCKYSPGYRGKRLTGHGVFDSLIREYALSTSLDSGLHRAFIDELLCPICGANTESYTLPLDPPAYHQTVHVAINRIRQVAEEGLLYSREGMGREKAFVGWVDIPADLVDGDGAEKWFPQGYEIRIGANRSCGMGQAVINLIHEYDPDSNLEHRLTRFNLALKEALTFYGWQADAVLPAKEEIEKDPQCYFTIDLRSEAVLQHDGLPTSAPLLIDKDTGTPWAEVVDSWIGWHVIKGWHQAAGLPMPARPAVAGCYLCHFIEKSDLGQLRALSMHGIGLMQEQGFGQLMVCDPFHYENLGWG